MPAANAFASAACTVGCAMAARERARRTSGSSPISTACARTTIKSAVGAFQDAKQLSACIGATSRSPVRVADAIGNGLRAPIHWQPPVDCSVAVDAGAISTLSQRATPIAEHLRNAKGGLGIGFAWHAERLQRSNAIGHGIAIGLGVRAPLG